MERQNVSQEDDEGKAEAKLNKQLSIMLYELFIAVLGVAILFLSTIVANADFGFFAFLTGLGLLMFGAVTLVSSISHMEKLRKRLVQLRIVRDQKGIILTIIVMVVGIGLTALIWFPLSWACYMVIDLCTSQFNYPPTARNIIAQCITLIAWMLIMIIGLFVLWGFASSLRRQEIGEPRYY